MKIADSSGLTPARLPSSFLRSLIAIDGGTSDRMNSATDCKSALFELSMLSNIPSGNPSVSRTSASTSASVVGTTSGSPASLVGALNNAPLAVDAPNAFALVVVVLRVCRPRSRMSLNADVYWSSSRPLTLRKTDTIDSIIELKNLVCGSWTVLINFWKSPDNKK